MGVWVLTQGKLSLINANIISVCLSVVYGLAVGGEEVILGTYESEERAKGVLNEIQKHVTLLAQSNRAGAEYYYWSINSVYQMPEE